jgi:methylase of polypeptide subunit release factors
MREHAQAQSRSDLAGNGKIATGNWLPGLRKMVRERSRGKPVQYILGDQPFGELDILCRKGVLIPRYDLSPLLVLI